MKMVDDNQKFRVFGATISGSQINKYFVEQEVLYKDYKDYKKDFQFMPKKADSYNAEKKTIVLYVPKFFDLAEELICLFNDTMLAKYPNFDIVAHGMNIGRIIYLFVVATDEELNERYKPDSKITQCIAYSKIVEKILAYRAEIETAEEETSQKDEIREELDFRLENDLIKRETYDLFLSKLDKDKKYSFEQYCELFNKCYADDTVKLETEKPKPSFVLSFKFGNYIVSPYVSFNDVYSIPLDKVENHYQALKNIVSFVNSLPLSSDKVKIYCGNPEIKEITDKLSQLRDKNKLEFMYLYEMHYDIATQCLSDEEYDEYCNAYDSWEVGLHI